MSGLGLIGKVVLCEIDGAPLTGIVEYVAFLRFGEVGQEFYEFALIVNVFGELHHLTTRQVTVLDEVEDGR